MEVALFSMNSIHPMGGSDCAAALARARWFVLRPCDRERAVSRASSLPPCFLSGESNDFTRNAAQRKNVVHPAELDCF
jgi:hypothetical protein